ncbi:conserved hypothetical protein [Desulfonatronospira thiodismutans ASO3-1]|uniref:Uncharacterized protein n=1 Tax=Desulfonatronospira thiodismutans ASO3-1 TaxID=555779 RepID=D6STJ1_9BACT|nr:MULTISPECIES: DUF5647 family protein [Desulfonatronospira]EFI34007.1 conserved hypothetical protein [Desulfonatronospira thiodismutans ASO3-1]
MTREELFKKNQQLSTEFELYLLEHPEVEEKIPDNAVLVLLPDYDQELASRNMEIAQVQKEAGQVVVYVRVEKLRKSRIDGLSLKVA